jgi:hypothetical protein
MTIEQFAVYQLNGNKKKRKKRRGKDPGTMTRNKLPCINIHQGLQDTVEQN